MFERLLRKIASQLRKSDLPYMIKAYVRRWLREFERSPEKRGLLKAFEDASIEYRRA